MNDKITVAIVQSSPVSMNLKESLEKAVALIKQAAAGGAKLITFGETWLAGYPAWLDFCPNIALWNHEPTKEIYARMRRNSLIVPDKETKMLGEVAAKHKIVLVIGINERVESGAGNGTLYNSLLTFGADGKLLNHHRKLVPTYTERLIHGNGDGDGLSVVKTEHGRIGGLICWEHWMPLARQAMHISGEDFHIAVFPTVHEMHQITSRQYAFEGRCFVLAAGSLMKLKDLPSQLLSESQLVASPEKFLLRGGSCIIAPDGSFAVEPVFDEEIIIIAELDLTMIDKEKMTLDVSGHYNRPDIFDFKVNRNSALLKTEHNLRVKSVKIILGILLAAVFAVLSLLHIYWAVGGRFGIASAIPTVGGVRVFTPSPFAAVMIAAALLAAMFVVLGQMNLLGTIIPHWIFRWASFGLATLFFLRAIGDFRLVGFFKRINDTGFAFWDTFLFSPLCLFIAISAFWLAYDD